MIKICYCTTVSGTISAFILESAKYLHEEKGWDISFICNEDDAFRKSIPEYIHFYPVRMRRGVNADGIHAVLQMARIFRRERFDLVQYSTPNASLYASIAAWLARIPIRLYCQWGMVYVGFSGLKRKLFKTEEKLVCRLSTWVEPDSKSNLQFAHEEGLYPKEKGSVIWNGSACGINLNKFDVSQKDAYRDKIRKEYSIPDDAFVFGFVGRITRDKGINELLTAYQRIRKGPRKVNLLIVGSKEPDGSIDKELFAWANSVSDVIFTGYSDVVEQMLSAMDCFVLPSYREGFGMGTIEAEAMGVPVIVTDIPGPRDAMVPGETGLIVEKANREALYDAMERMMCDKAKNDHYSVNGVQFVRTRFDQNVMFQEIYKDRRRLLEKNDREQL